MADARTLTLSNRIEEIRTLEAALMEFAEQHELPPDALFQIQLSLEEIFTNVVSYAHDDEEEHQIEVVLAREGDRVTVEVADDGTPFNPLQEAPEMDADSSLEERGIGGAGVALAKELMTELRYRRDGDRNRLTMIKEL